MSSGIANALGASLCRFTAMAAISATAYFADPCGRDSRSAARGRLGETITSAAGRERPTSEVVHAVCGLLDRLKPKPAGSIPDDQIAFVADRPGHNRRYAIDHANSAELAGSRGNVRERHRENGAVVSQQSARVDEVASGEYRKWVEANYAQRA